MMNINSKLITDITIQKKDERRRNIFVDGVFAFSLSDVDVLYYKLKVNEEISEELYNKILDNIVYEQSKFIALKYLSHRIRCEKEVRQKLIDKDIPEEVIEKTVGFLKKYNYLNDYDFARAYIKDKLHLTGYGRKKIAYDLKYLGIKEDVIIELEETERVFEKEEEVALKLGRKKSKRLDLYDFKDKNKLTNYLIRRGFGYDIIKNVIETLIYEFEEE
ncbi:MAG: RecX family transcriptional regulator [Lachnospirales bacterium]